MAKRGLWAASILVASALGGCATQGPAGEPSPQQASVQRGAAGAASKPAFRRADILGRDARALDAALGAPALVRREGQGEFRRYALADCALIVILYPDDKGRATAGHIDAAALRSGEKKPDLDRCLAAGVAAR